ncbi:MAG: hypothetical protein LQ346_004061 [Caloplaca aetnensis]|nr:MAG: hypothetical protein LQ346_004061 [Caloplaca aetnensis]
MANSTQTSPYLYKILPAAVDIPIPPPRTFVVPKTPLDIDSGFIHFSTHSQVPYVLDRFFNTIETSIVWLIKVNYAALTSGGDVRWEPAGKDGSLFAHLYGGEVQGSAVDDVKKLDRGTGWDSSLQKLTVDGWLR